MAKKTTLADLDKKIDALTTIVAKGFGAIADDIADVRRELKSDIVRVQEQVTSIEGQLRNGRYESRLTKLENHVFGEAL